MNHNELIKDRQVEVQRTCIVEWKWHSAHDSCIKAVPPCIASTASLIPSDDNGGVLYNILFVDAVEAGSGGDIDTLRVLKPEFELAGGDVYFEMCTTSDGTATELSVKDVAVLSPRIGSIIVSSLSESPTFNMAVESPSFLNAHVAETAAADVLNKGLLQFRVLSPIVLLL